MFRPLRRLSRLVGMKTPERHGRDAAKLGGSTSRVGSNDDFVVRVLVCRLSFRPNSLVCRCSDSREPSVSAKEARFLSVRHPLVQPALGARPEKRKVLLDPPAIECSVILPRIVQVFGIEFTHLV